MKNILHWEFYTTIRPLLFWLGFFVLCTPGVFLSVLNKAEKKFLLKTVRKEEKFKCLAREKDSLDQ